LWDKHPTHKPTISLELGNRRPQFFVVEQENLLKEKKKEEEEGEERTNLVMAMPERDDDEDMTQWASESGRHAHAPTLLLRELFEHA
jgi:hypothetical protein